LEIRDDNYRYWYAWYDTDSMDVHERAYARFVFPGDMLLGDGFDGGQFFLNRLQGFDKNYNYNLSVFSFHEIAYTSSYNPGDFGGDRLRYVYYDDWADWSSWKGYLLVIACQFEVMIGSDYNFELEIRDNNSNWWYVYSYPGWLDGGKYHWVRFEIAAEDLINNGFSAGQFYLNRLRAFDENDYNNLVLETWDLGYTRFYANKYLDRKNSFGVYPGATLQYHINYLDANYEGQQFMNAILLDPRECCSLFPHVSNISDCWIGPLVYGGDTISYSISDMDISRVWADAWLNGYYQEGVQLYQKYWMEGLILVSFEDIEHMLDTPPSENTQVNQYGDILEVIISMENGGVVELSYNMNDGALERFYLYNYFPNQENIEIYEFEMVRTSDPITHTTHHTTTTIPTTTSEEPYPGDEKTFGVEVGDELEFKVKSMDANEYGQQVLSSLFLAYAYDDGYASSSQLLVAGDIIAVRITGITDNDVFATITLNGDTITTDKMIYSDFTMSYYVWALEDIDNMLEYGEAEDNGDTIVLRPDSEEDTGTVEVEIYKNTGILKSFRVFDYSSEYNGGQTMEIGDFEIILISDGSDGGDGELKITPGFGAGPLLIVMSTVVVILRKRR
ncbi:MAG: hypothetical protein JSV04_02715, partial [Candidatus Heimdallarchaeota archaeon]